MTLTEARTSPAEATPPPRGLARVAALKTPTRTNRRRLRTIAGVLLAGLWRLLKAIAGDVRRSWVWSAAPPPMREVWSARTPKWALFDLLRHDCIDASIGPPLEITDLGWRPRNITRSPEGLVPREHWRPVRARISCDCSPTTPEERKRNTRRMWVCNVWHGSWVAWNLAVALPLTFVLYVVAWILQHPARFLLALVIVTPILIGVPR